MLSLYEDGALQIAKVCSSLVLDRDHVVKVEIVELLQCQGSAPLRVSFSASPASQNEQNLRLSFYFIDRAKRPEQ